MKKILSMLLCIALLASALVSCGGGETNPPEADRPNRTLRMAIVVADDTDEKKTTQEGIAAMQKAFNEYTEVLLATHVEFECIKASEYKARMTAIMNEVADEKGKQTAGKEDAMANAGTDTGTELDDEENKFPAASKGQFDILLIEDEEMYNEYIKNGWLVGLNSHLTGNFKPLNTKILAGAKKLALVNDECYGIPANTAYGSYKYVKINKQAADYYHLDVNSITSLTDAYRLITMMEQAGANGLARWEEKYPTSFSVIGTTADEFVLSNVQYLSSDLSSQSLFGLVHDYRLSMGSIASISTAKNLLKDTEYSAYLSMKFSAEKEGYFLEEGETVENCLIDIVDGDYALRHSDPDNYYFAPIKYPDFVKSELFGGMLAVSKFSVDEKRSLEIIQELMTNTTKSDLLNILLYGDAESNYYMENDCVVYRKNSNYHVASDYLFGNLREFAYPCASLGQNADTYKYAASHISDLATRQPAFDEYFPVYFSQIDTEKWKAFDAYCNEKYDYLMASADEAEFDTRKAELIAEMEAEDGTFETLANQYVSDNNANYSTLGGAFYFYTKHRGSNPPKYGDPFAVKDNTTEPAA